jgi:hypothetical protein
MRLTLCIAVVTLVTGLGIVRPATSQSLGDVARKEEERRKDEKSPAKVYTNRDLSAPPLSSAPPESAKPAAAPSEPARDAAKPGDDKGKPGDDKGKDGLAKGQAYWSGHRKELQATLDHDKVLVDAVQSRINALTADFASRSDPIQRAGIERDRLQALAELSRLQKEIKDTQKALGDFDEEARKAGVPPGWLR